LLRGDYDCRNVTPSDANCVKTSSDDLIVRWKTKSGADAIATVDWDGSSGGAASAPQQVLISYDNATSYTYELPTKLLAKLEVGTQKLGSLEFTGDWIAGRPYPTSGGQSVLLRQFTFKGEISNLAGVKLFEVLGLNYNATNSRITTEGDIRLSNGTDVVRTRWDVDFEINALTTKFSGVNFGNVTGGFFVLPLAFAEGLRPTGTSRFAFSLEINAKVYAASMKLKNWVFDTAGTAVSVSVEEGVISIESLKASFNGVFDDANRNCVPGENLLVTTANGTQSLEKIILDNFNPYRCK
jgi:hypothetical protein